MGRLLRGSHHGRRSPLTDPVIAGVKAAGSTVSGAVVTGGTMSGVVASTIAAGAIDGTYHTRVAAITTGAVLASNRKGAAIATMSSPDRSGGQLGRR